MFAGSGGKMASMFGRRDNLQEFWLSDKLGEIQRGVSDTRSDIAGLTSKVESMTSTQIRHEQRLERIDNDLTTLRQIPSDVADVKADVHKLSAGFTELDKFRASEQSAWRGVRNMFAVAGALVPILAALWTVGKYIGQLP